MKSTTRFNNKLLDLIQDYSQKPTTRVTLQELIRIGSTDQFDSSNISTKPNLHSAHFFKNELPIRLAKRVVGKYFYEFYNEL